MKQHTQFSTDTEEQMHDERQELIERETQILDGLRWADCLLASFGMQPRQIDAASLVTLRTLEWVDPTTPVGDVIAILSTLDESAAARVVS